MMSYRTECWGRADDDVMEAAGGPAHSVEVQQGCRGWGCYLARWLQRHTGQYHYYYCSTTTSTSGFTTTATVYINYKHPPVHLRCTSVKCRCVQQYRYCTSFGGAAVLGALLVWGSGGGRVRRLGGVRGVWMRWGGVAPVVLRLDNLKETGALAADTDSPDPPTDTNTSIPNTPETAAAAASS